MKENLLIINHDEFGEEQFSIAEAKYNLSKPDDEKWEFLVSFITNGALKRSEELEEVVDTRPHFEAAAILPLDALELYNGRIISQKEGYDYEREIYLSNFYYFAHDSIEKIEIELIEVKENWVIASIKAKAVINGSNGNDPDATLLITPTKFMLDKNLEREVS